MRATRTGPDLKEYVPAEREVPDPDAAYKPTGGRMEICYIAVPEDPLYPALLTLYEGFRTPVGGEGTLLDPANLDTIREIRERCRPVATGILHFGITWRRVFAKNWDATQGKVGEREAYVGSTWDSTRALDKQFALYKDELSLGDPSDDIFPAWARLEITLMGPTTLGLGRGETSLAGRINDDDRALTVLHPTRLTGPGQDERMLKIDGEWIGYRVSKVDAVSGKITGIDRGLRDTKKAAHEPRRRRVRRARLAARRAPAGPRLLRAGGQGGEAAVIHRRLPTGIESPSAVAGRPRAAIPTRPASPSSRC